MQIPRFFTTACAIASLPFISITNGQEAETDRVAFSTTTPANTDATAAQPQSRSNPFADGSIDRFDLKFEGGSVESLIDSIQATTGERPNVIIPDDQKGAHFPSFQLTAVTLEDLFVALSLATEFEFGSDSGEIWVLRGPKRRTNVSAAPNFAGLGASRGAPRVAGSRSAELLAPVRSTGVTKQIIEQEIIDTTTVKKSTEPIGIGHLLATFDIEDITTAILQTWESTQPDHDGKIAFHKDASLLILTGTPDQLALANIVILQLQEEAQRRAVEKQPTP